MMEGSTYWGSEQNRSEGPNLDNDDMLSLYHWENLVAIGGSSEHIMKNIPSQNTCKWSKFVAWQHLMDTYTLYCYWKLSMKLPVKQTNKPHPSSCPHVLHWSTTVTDSSHKTQFCMNYNSLCSMEHFTFNNTMERSPMDWCHQHLPVALLFPLANSIPTLSVLTTGMLLMNTSQ